MIRKKIIKYTEIEKNLKKINSLIELFKRKDKKNYTEIT